MKTARYIFTLIALVLLMVGRAYADEPSKHSSEQDSREKPATSEHPGERSPALEKSSKIIPLSTTLKHAPGSEFHPFAVKKAAPAANEELLKIKTENRPAQPALLPVGSGTTAPRPGIVLARSTTVTAIGGLSSASTKHSAAMIDGAAVKPKP